MRIRVKLYASLAERMPKGVKPHEGFELEITKDATPARVLAQLDVPRELAHLVLLNGEYLPPAQRERALFKDGDVLAVWPPVAGG